MENKQCVVPFSELIDILTIDQIKEVLKTGNKKSYIEEINQLMKNIDIYIKEKDIKLTSRFIRLIIILSQINLHIWITKENMMKNVNNQNEFDSNMKLAHQLNGIRNRIKNLLNEKDNFSSKTNVNIDNLEGWDISL